MQTWSAAFLEAIRTTSSMCPARTLPRPLELPAVELPAQLPAKLPVEVVRVAVLADRFPNHPRSCYLVHYSQLRSRTSGRRRRGRKSSDFARWLRNAR